MFPRGRVLTPWDAEKRGGGNPRKSPVCRGAPAAFAAVLTGLAALAAAPPAAMAQTCASAPAVAGTPSAAPAAWTFGGTLAGTATGIDCNTLTNGLEMTLGPDLAMGTEGTPLTERGIYVDAEEDGNSDVTVTGAAVIHSSQSGVYMKRDGKGLLGLELTGGRIAVTGAAGGFGIELRHKGKAGEDSKGVRIVSGADIDLSGSTSDDKNGIYITTEDAPRADGRATTTVPVTVRVTGGTIDVGTSAGGSAEGTAVSVNQHARGDTAITVEPGASLGREGSVAAGYGISVGHDAVSEGDITITHRGRIYGGTGISVENSSTSERKGNIAVTTDPGSVIVAKTADSIGIYAANSATGGAGDVTVAHSGGIDADGIGIQAYTDGNGGVTVTTETGSTVVTKTANADGIRAYSSATGGTGDITVTHSGGIDAGGNGIQAYTDGNGDVTVTTGTGSTVVAKKAGIEASTNATGGAADLTVAHSGGITADGTGIDVHTDGNGDITVTTETGSTVVAKGDSSHGINALTTHNNGNGDIKIAHNGSLEGGRSGIYTYNSGKGDVSVTTGSGSAIVARGTQNRASGIRAGVWENLGDDSARTHGGGDLTIVHRGTITAKGAGIRAFNRVVGAKGTGTIDVTTERGSRVVAERQGIVVWHEGSGRSTVTVRGTVRGDSAHTGKSDTKYAGVRVEANQQTPKTLRGADAEGGVIVIGPRAHVSSGSGTAVMIDAGTGKWALVLERDRHGLAGHVEGTILNPAATAFSARTGEDGAATALKVGDRVDMRGETMGVFDAVHRTRLATVTGGHEFKKLSETRIHHDRARVYEALPSVLLDLVRPASLAGRTAATRGTAGGGGRVWARLEAGDGKRRAAASTTGKGYRGVALAWDTEHRSVEAGLELPAGDRLALGLGVRHLRGKATVKEGGRIDVSGLGLGLSVAHTGAGGLYIDGRLSHTRFGDIDLASDARGSLVSNLSGDGFAAGVGVGRRIAREGVALTPRGGLAWSSVSLGAFDDIAGVEGGGRVVPGRTRSLVGGLGVLAEFGGSEGSSGRAFASLDLEREFSPDREVVASGTGLSSKVRATWLRLGLGGALDLGSSGAVRLSGRGHYATAGSGNTGYGGSVTLSLRF